MKKLLLILTVVLFTTFCANAQSRVAGGVDPSLVLRFYPNPATSFVNFDFEKSYDKGYSIQIYNFLGRKMYETTNVNQRTTLDLTDYTRGVYVYQLRDRSGRMVESGKFQVSK